jgi:hypothetical protein
MLGNGVTDGFEMSLALGVDGNVVGDGVPGQLAELRGIEIERVATGVVATRGDATGAVEVDGIDRSTLPGVASAPPTLPGPSPSRGAAGSLAQDRCTVRR